MRTEELFYTLDPALIAREPASPRDASRLMVFHRHSRNVEHRRFRDLPDYLSANDLLVLNDTRVLPARLVFEIADGRRMEGLFLAEDSPRRWTVLLNVKNRVTPGRRIVLIGRGPAETACRFDVLLLDRVPHTGQWTIEIESELSTGALLNLVGRPPLPPYILRARKGDRAAAGLETPDADWARDNDSYQTIYAAAAGALAAPTAGLHFTPELFQRLADKGVERAMLTLHVGRGTFQPVKAATLAEHVMHTERFSIPAATAEAIGGHRGRGGRLVLVGTTTVRALESVAGRVLAGEASAAPAAINEETNLLIEPGFRFQLTDALITNFHLPGSTLLALVAALIGLEEVKRLYALAIEQRYRFYSYGDAMLILP